MEWVYKIVHLDGCGGSMSALVFKRPVERDKPEEIDDGRTFSGQ